MSTRHKKLFFIFCFKGTHKEADGTDVSPLKGPSRHIFLFFKIFSFS